MKLLSVLQGPLLVALLLSAWTVAPVLARLGQTQTTTAFYPIRERNAREATKEISYDELDEFMLTFSFDSPPKVLNTFWLDLYMTDGFLPTSPSINTVEKALANFALPELNGHYLFHTVKQVNVTVLAQQSIVTSSHLEGSDSNRRRLQTLGSQLQTQVSVIFRNEPSPPVSEVETTLATIMKAEGAMDNFISNLTTLAQGDPELAGVTHAERREEDDIAVRDDDEIDPIQAPDSPQPTQTQQRNTKIEILIPVIAACCLAMAVIALFLARRKGTKQMMEQESHAATQIGGPMVQRVNIFMADTESDVFSFEAALAESPSISRLSSSAATNDRSASERSDYEEDGSDVFSGVASSEITSPRESRSVFSFLSGFKSEASTVVVSNTTKAKDKNDDAVALATFKASISPKASKATPKDTTPKSRHSLFTFSEEEEGDLDDEDDDDDDDDSEMEPLVVESKRSSLVAPPPPHEQQQQKVATTTAANEGTVKKRSGTPINNEEEVVVTRAAAMGMKSLLNSDSSDDSVSTEEITAVVGVADIVAREQEHDVKQGGGDGTNSGNDANALAKLPKDKEPELSPPAVETKKSGGFSSFFTSKKQESSKPTPVAAPEPTSSSLSKKYSFRDRTSPGSKKPDSIKASSPWGACSNKAAASVAPSPKPGEVLSSPWAAVPPRGEDAVESESLEFSSSPPSSEDQAKDTAVEPPTVAPSSASSKSEILRSLTGSKSGVYLERAKIPREDDSVISSATFYALKAQAEQSGSGSKTSWSIPGYESDPGPRGGLQRQSSDKTDKVSLAWDNPLQASSNAAQAKAFVEKSSPPDTTPSWKKKARENAAKAALAGSNNNSLDYPSPGDYSSPGARAKGRRHAKSTTADGTTDYQEETMQQRDESLATFDAVSLSDSEASASDTQEEEEETPQTNKTAASSSVAGEHSMFSEDSRVSSEASASRQLLSDLVWLEKKIAGVASSTASPLSDPKVKEQQQRPSTIDQSDSLSFASGDGTCTSSLHDERKKPAAHTGTAPPPAVEQEPPARMSSIICRDCYAPPGKLRIVIHSTKDGPAVHTVKKDSSLEGHVFPGDLIISVDNVDTRSYTAEQVMKMMTARTKYERKITVLHFDTNPNGSI